MTAQTTARSATQSVRMAQRWLRVQALVSLALSALLLPLFGGVAAYSAIFGGLAAVLPSALFAMILAPRFGGDSASFLGAAVLAEGLKWVLTGAVCVGVILWVDPLAPGWFFVGMVVAIFAGWAGLILND